MTRAETVPQRTFIDSDRIQGMPVYGQDQRRIGAIERLLVEKAGGQIAYALVVDSDSLCHVIPWRKLAYSAELNGYEAEISEADLRSAPNTLLPGEGEPSGRAQEELLHDFYRIPPYWRAL